MIIEKREASCASPLALCKNTKNAPDFRQTVLCQ
jgi:hypothetical protein